MMLTLDQAASIVDGALAERGSQDFQPLRVVVLDAGGHALALTQRIFRTGDR